MPTSLAIVYRKGRAEEATPPFLSSRDNHQYFYSQCLRCVFMQTIFTRSCKEYLQQTLSTRQPTAENRRKFMSLYIRPEGRERQLQIPGNNRFPVIRTQLLLCHPDRAPQLLLLLERNAAQIAQAKTSSVLNVKTLRWPASLLQFSPHV